MEDLKIVLLAFIIDLTITAFLYMILPIVTYFTDKKGFTKKQLIQFVVFNSCVVCAIFWIFYIVTRYRPHTKFKSKCFLCFS